MTRRGAAFGLAFVLAAGTLVTGARLGAQSFWIDEAITLVPVTQAQNTADLVARVRVIDTQPPASHAVLFFLRGLLPHDEFGWRLPSLLAVEAGVLLLALLGGRLFGAAGLFWTGLCAQISPYLLFYAMEARNYALWFLAVALAGYAMTRCLQAIAAGRPPAEVAIAAALWAAANALGLWTHLFHLFALLAQGIVLAGLVLVLRPPRPIVRRGALVSAASLGASLLLFLPWIVTIAQGEHGVARGVGWTRQLHYGGFLYFPFALLFGFSLGPDLRELHEEPARGLLLAHPVPLLLAAVAIAGLAAGLAVSLRGARRAGDPPAAVLFLLVPAAGFAGPVVYALARDFPLVPRHLMFLWPLVPLLQAHLASRRPRLQAVVAAVVCLQAVAAFNLLFDPAYAKDDERGAVRWAEARSGARPVILGDAAPLYAEKGLGLMKALTEPKSDRVLGSGATDLWLVDNRPWEDPQGNIREKTGQAAERLGLLPAESEARFRGLVLRHWSKETR
ncbi:MAG TPA: hypothetical protein VFQ07_12570 [Candidatus Polarisedimenticolia bacterium]|nr:hypothetical protein [Candidatus Polarisedimenticolia bacterium]